MYILANSKGLTTEWFDTSHTTNFQVNCTRVNLVNHVYHHENTKCITHVHKKILQKLNTEKIANDKVKRYNLIFN